ncbi:MAG TPA: hypothetical protein VK929_10285 [Longimicrobiales bacterium]|nr:hypothetical protein [Longimicrobiales bacterium]
MRFSAVRPASLLLAVLLLIPACATSPAPAVGPEPEFAAVMTVERFLTAANQNDLDTMAALFGNREGSITRTWSKREQDERMFLLASLLRHSDYAVVGEQIVPGRRDEATQLNVRVVVASGPVQVPFTMVRSRGQWLVEQVGIENITRGRTQP